MIFRDQGSLRFFHGVAKSYSLGFDGAVRFLLAITGAFRRLLQRPLWGDFKPRTPQLQSVFDFTLAAHDVTCTVVVNAKVSALASPKVHVRIGVCISG